MVFLFSKHYDSTIKNEDTLLKLFEREIPEVQSIAMGNSVKNIKKICKYETKPNDEDGVAYVIDHLL